MLTGGRDTPPSPRRRCSKPLGKWSSFVAPAARSHVAPLGAVAKRRLGFTGKRARRACPATAVGEAGFADQGHLQVGLRDPKSRSDSM